MRRHSLTDSGYMKMDRLAKLSEDELKNEFNKTRRYQRLASKPWYVHLADIILFAESVEELQTMYYALVVAWRQQNFDIVYNHVITANPTGIA